MYQGVQVARTLGREVHEILPRALDDLELTKCLQLSQEMNHFCLNDPAVVPLVAQGYNDQFGTRTEDDNLPGIVSNSLDPDVTLIHPCVRAVSTRLKRQRWWNSFSYSTIAFESSTALRGASTLYSREKQSQPTSPCEYSSIRASSRRRTSGESYCALLPRIAVSRSDVRW